MPLEDTPPISSRFNTSAGTSRDNVWARIAGDTARIARMRAIEARHARLAAKLLQHSRRHEGRWQEQEVARLSKRSAPVPRLEPKGAPAQRVDIRQQAAANVAARMQARRDRLAQARDNTIKHQVLGIEPDGRMARARRAANRSVRSPAHPLKREVHQIIDRAAAARRKAQALVKKTYKARIERARQRGSDHPARDVGKALAQRMARIDRAQHRLTHQAFLRAGIDRMPQSPKRTRGGPDMMG